MESGPPGDYSFRMNGTERLQLLKAIKDAHAALDLALAAHDAARVTLDAARDVLARTLATALDSAHADAARDASESRAAAELEAADEAMDKNGAVTA